MVNSEFSWDQFQKNEQTSESQKPEPTKIQEEEGSQEYSWGNFQNTSTYQGKIDPTADESTFGYLARNTASNAVRAGEGYLGRYGNIQKSAETFISKNPSSLGMLGAVLSELMGPEKWEQMIRGEGPLKPKLPTSEDIRQGVTEPLTGEYLKPKTKGEKEVQEFSSDVGAMGRVRGGTTRQNLVNNFGIPAAANIVKKVVNELGFGEQASMWTKMAAWTALTLLNNVNAPCYAAQLMNEGRAGFGPNVTANVPRYQNSIDAVGRNMLQGDPRSQLAQQQIAGIRNDMANGQNSMQDLMNRYDAINAAKRDRGLFALRRNDRRAAIRNINQVRDAVRGEIEHLGAANPQALQSWQTGVQAFATIHQSNAMTNWIRGVMSDPYSKTAVATLFGSGATKAPAILAGTGVAVPALYKTGQVAYRVWNDPNLAHYYWESIRAAAEQNAGAFTKNFNALNAGYEKKYGGSSVSKSSQKNKNNNPD